MRTGLADRFRAENTCFKARLCQRHSEKFFQGGGRESDEDEEEEKQRAEKVSDGKRRSEGAEGGAQRKGVDGQRM